MASSLPSLQDEDHEKYKKLISTLPKAAWLKNTFNLINYKNFWYVDYFLKGLLSAQDHFKPQPNDILIASAPKTGTTWLTALAFAIVTRSKFDDTLSPLLNKGPHDCVPFMEFDLARNSSNRDVDMPLISTHAPFSALPSSVVDSGCKIVYVWRDLKDAFVSLWYFVVKIYLDRGNSEEPLNLDEEFEMFCNGVVNYGPYWDHIKGYLEARSQHPDRVLILKYEQMKNETTFVVKKLADFMGYGFSKEEEENGVIERIIKLCSFENLSNLEVNKIRKHHENPFKTLQNDMFFRKGNVGDWHNELTQEMSLRLDKIIEEKLGSFLI